MKKYILTIPFFLLFYYSFTQSKTKVDSLIEVYKTHPIDTNKINIINDIVQIKLYSNPEEAKGYIEEMIEISEKINYPVGKAKGYHRLAGYYLNQDKIDLALINFKKSQKINKNVNNLTGIVSDNAQLGLIYGRKKEFDSAFYYLEQNVELYENRNRNDKEKNKAFKFIGSTFHTLANTHTIKGSYHLALQEELKALQHYEDLGDPLYVADAKNSLASIENELGNYKQALNYINSALKTYKDNDDVFFQTLATINRGVSLQGLNKHKDAITNYKEGIALAKLHKYKGREALLWSNMGNSYFELEDYNNAKLSYWQSKALYKSLNYNLEISGCYNNLGKLYNKTKKLDSALYYLNNAIKISDSTDFLRVLANGYHYRSNTYKLLNNYKKSLSDFEAYTTLKDSMFNEQKLKQIEELRTIYETEKKEQFIGIQKNEIALLTAKNKVNNLQLALLGLGLILALLGLYAYYQRNKRNKLAKENAQAELEFKTKELTTHALHLAKKNEVLNDLKRKAKAFKADANSDPGYQMLIQTINFDLQDDNNWENFSRYFEEVHKGFNKKVKERFPNITSNDLRLMALLKMNLSSKEMANILNISNDGIKKARQRLRKKMGLNSGESLEAVIISI